jgi:hypothetical protein
MNRTQQIKLSEKIEETVDDVIEAVLSDNNVEIIGTKDATIRGTAVSAETWLAVKACILALLAEDEENIA